MEQHLPSIRIRQAITFDDVLLEPGPSEVIPGDVDIRSRFSKEIAINVPIISAAMDTVTEAGLAIAMAQFGGIGVIHRNLSIEEQAEQVRRVKRFESGMVVNPVTVTPDVHASPASRAERAAEGFRHPGCGSRSRRRSAQAARHHHQSRCPLRG